MYRRILVAIENSAADQTITLVMDDGRRPPKVPKASVEVSMNDQVLGKVTVGPDFKPYTLPIPPALAATAGASGAPVRVKLVTNTWRPSEVLPVADDRELGAMVDRVGGP